MVEFLNKMEIAKDDAPTGQEHAGDCGLKTAKIAERDAELMAGVSPFVETISGSIPARGIPFLGLPQVAE